MPVSNSRLSYGDCFALFERALADPKGARYQCPPGDFGQNQYFRMRMHQARKLDRDDNKAMLEPGDPLYGRSVYDVLIVQLKQDTEGLWWTYVVHTEINEGEIEDLSEIEGEYTEVPLIEQGTQPVLELEPVLAITDQSIRRRV